MTRAWISSARRRISSYFSGSTKARAAVSASCRAWKRCASLESSCGLMPSRASCWSCSAESFEFQFPPTLGSKPDPFSARIQKRFDFLGE